MEACAVPEAAGGLCRACPESGETGDDRETGKENGQRGCRKTARFIQWYPEELPLAAVLSAEEEEPRSLVPMKGFLARERTQAVNRPCAVYARAGITKSAVATARRLVCLLWPPVIRREFCTDMSREGLVTRFRRYRITYEGWGKADNRPAF
jgi:hypothetical protein